jgi:hypothetical protein
MVSQSPVLDSRCSSVCKSPHPQLRHSAVGGGRAVARDVVADPLHRRVVAALVTGRCELESATTPGMAAAIAFPAIGKVVISYLLTRQPGPS